VRQSTARSLPNLGRTHGSVSGATAVEICARSIRDLRAVGAEKIYVSNLGNQGAARRLTRILDAV